MRYQPKRLDEAQSVILAKHALRQRVDELAERVGRAMAEQWARDQRPRLERVRIPNLLTMSLDDARGTYRGAGHRQSPDQSFRLGWNDATPGLVPGELPAGSWLLTLSAHTLVSAHVEVEIQIGADTAVS